MSASFLRLRPRTVRPDRLLLGVLVIFAGVLAVIGLRNGVMKMVERQIHGAAGGRDLRASWKSASLDFGGGVRLHGLRLVSARGDTAFRAESLSVRVEPLSILLLRPRLRSLSLAHAEARMGSGVAADPDTLVPEAGEARGDAPRSRKVKRAAERLVQLLLAPARKLPSVEVRDLVIASSSGADSLRIDARIDWLDLESSRGGIALSARGRLARDPELPFDVTFEYGNDDHLRGGARLEVEGESLRLGLDGRVVQDRVRGEVRLGESTVVTLGNLPFTLTGSIARHGPRVKLALAADGITQGEVEESVPRAVLGPLNDVSVRGSFDYRLGLDLDFDKPDSVQVHADVIPHGLQIDRAGTRLNLLGLGGPFVASIHLPRGVVVRRELSEANPHFRPLADIDPLLASAVVTNEDGGFFRHRGFNTDAVESSIAANLKAGAFRRGAGTITMQLARNLYLGHEKTIARKAQEVVLAWMLEHLTGLSKQRLLEIYLNIIEWGPGIHGADEATQYYFAHGAGFVTPDEALFLSTVVPAPKKWRYRIDAGGELRNFERAQMHFIGRAMIAKGWLAPEALPPADALRVELRGPAGDFFRPAEGDSTRERKEKEFKDWFFDDKKSI